MRGLATTSKREGSAVALEEIKEDIGYLKRATEDNTKQISKFYELLDDHMDNEDKKVASIDKKLTVLTVLVVVTAGDAIPWASVLSMLKAL